VSRNVGPNRHPYVYSRLPSEIQYLIHVEGIAVEFLVAFLNPYVPENSCPKNIPRGVGGNHAVLARPPGFIVLNRS
jgi:hypothetical protein